MEFLGYQIIADLYGCDSEVLKEASRIEALMLEAAEKSKMTIVSSTFHQFNPHGVSGAVIISESHLAIHTWPEHNYAAVDLFTCGDVIDAQTALDILSKGLGCEHISVTEMRRGKR